MDRLQLLLLQHSLSPSADPSRPIVLQIMSKVNLAFFGVDDDTSLFSAPAGYVPRPGDIVRLRVERCERCYNDDWDDEVWEEARKDAGAWEVVRVEQEFVKYKQFIPPSESIHVYVKPVGPDAT